VNVRDSMAKKDTKLENLSKTVHAFVEEIRISERNGLDLTFMDFYVQQAGKMMDSRQQAKVKHAFKDILGIVLFGVVAGNDEWEDIYDFAVDAMNAQKETARVVVQEAHGDYCLALKGNQKQAYEEIRNYFACKDLLEKIRQKAGQYQSGTEKSTYAITIREFFITDDIRWFEDRGRWEKLKSIGYGRKTITIRETGESHIEERYYLCSIKPIAGLFAIVVRRHWNIENNLHWTLDVVFREDSLDSKEKKAVHNLAWDLSDGSSCLLLS